MCYIHRENPICMPQPSTHVEPFLLFVASSRPALVSYAYSLTFDEDRAEELVSATVLKIAERFRTGLFEGDQYLLYCIMSLKKNWYRECRDDRHFVRLDAPRGLEGTFDCYPDEENDSEWLPPHQTVFNPEPADFIPEEIQAEQLALVLSIEAFITASCSDQEVACWQLKHANPAQQLTNTEIAVLLGVSRPTVGRLLERVKEKVRAEFRPWRKRLSDQMAEL